MKEIDINKIPLKIIVPVIIGFVLLFIYAYYFYIPYSKKIKELKEKTSKLELNIAQAKMAKVKYKDLDRKLEELKQQKLELERKIPKEKEMPQVIKTLKAIADEYNITIRSISSTAAVKDRYFFRVTYQINVSGSYHDIGRFFAAIALNERILNVENVNITGGELSNVSFVLVSYQYGG